MIRIEEKSVRLGIRSAIFAHKKRARVVRVPGPGGARPRASASLEQIRRRGKAGRPYYPAANLIAARTRLGRRRSAFPCAHQFDKAAEQEMAVARAGRRL